MNSLQKIGVYAAAAFIGLSPAIPQIFGIGDNYIRSWVMFSGVGQGIMKGAFTLQHADGTQQSFTPLEIMDLPYYPKVFSYTFDRILLDRAAIAPIVGPFCRAHVSDGSVLSYSGYVGVRDGWAIFEETDLCPPKQRAETELKDNG